MIFAFALAGCAPPPPIIHASAAHTWNDDNQLLVDQVDQTDAHWQCPQRIGGEYIPGCETAITATPTCEGVRCEASKRLDMSSDGGQRGVIFTFVGREPGRMTKWIELRDHTGHVERRLVGTDTVLAAPETVLTCQVRDVVTGEYVACPPGLSPDELVFISTGYTAAARLADFRLELDGKQVPLAGQTMPLRFRTKLASGHHELVALGDHVPLATLALDVR